MQVSGAGNKSHVAEWLIGFPLNLLFATPGSFCDLIFVSQRPQRFFYFAFFALPLASFAFLPPYPQKPDRIYAWLFYFAFFAFPLASFAFLPPFPQKPERIYAWLFYFAFFALPLASFAFLPPYPQKPDRIYAWVSS